MEKRHLKFLITKKGESTIQAVDKEFQIREDTLASIKKNLMLAQLRMKNQADKKRIEIKFEEGDWVLVQLKPYR